MSPWRGATGPIATRSGRLRFDSLSFEGVGMVEDTREWGLHSPGPPMVYAIVLQSGGGGEALRFILRSEAPVASLTPERSARQSRR